MMRKVRNNSIWVWIVAILFCIALIVIIVTRTNLVEVQNANPGQVPADIEQGVP